MPNDHPVANGREWFRRGAELATAPLRKTRVGQWTLHQLRARRDPDFANLLHTGTRQDRFAYFYESNMWNNEESRSGAGSTLDATIELREQLQEVLQRLGITSLLDAGCGDFNWMSTLNFDGRYVGVDIVPSLIAENSAKYGRPDRTFAVKDLVEERLDEPFDMILCREVLFHLPNSDVRSVLRNFAASGSKYLLVTSDLRTRVNVDIEAGGHRHLNLYRKPFGLPPAIEVLENKKVASRRQLLLFELSSIRGLF